jgi:hypothetical protein
MDKCDLLMINLHQLHRSCTILNISNISSLQELNLGYISSLRARCSINTGVIQSSGHRV